MFKASGERATQCPSYEVVGKTRANYDEWQPRREGGVQRGKDNSRASARKKTSDRFFPQHDVLSST